jgi:hypothetical protein
LRKSSNAASHLLNDLAHTPSVNNLSDEASGANRMLAFLQLVDLRRVAMTPLERCHALSLKIRPIAEQEWLLSAKI